MALWGDAPVAGTAKGPRGPTACTTCAKAKSRCIAGPRGQEKCERCHRLGKPCSSQTPAPTRKRKKPRTTRVAELERRLEDLTALIESVQRQGPAAPSPPDLDQHSAPSRSPNGLADRVHHLRPLDLAETGESIRTFRQNCWENPLGHIFPNHPIFGGDLEHQQSPASGVVPPAAAAVLPPPSSGYPSAQTTAASSIGSSPHQQPHPRSSEQHRSCPWPQDDEAEAFLRVYRENLNHLFPFVIVPPHLSSAELWKQRPFLWKVVMMGACRSDGRRQAALGNELLREVTETAFMRPRKNLDLLQGLQMLIAWYHYNLDSFQMMNLLFLTMSITTSLGAVETKGIPDKEGYSSESLEQMRAFAGTYYLVTVTFTTNKRPDALMNNANAAYLATCCRALLSRMEYPTDELVVHLVRAQKLLQGISQGFAQRKAAPNEKRVPQVHFIHGLRERIRGVASALPPHIRANPTLRGHFLVAEILIYENSLEELYHCPFLRQSREAGPIPFSPARTTGDVSERVAMLWECAHLVHAFLENRLPDEKTNKFPRVVCPTSPDLTYVFLTMIKLATVQVPGWDLARARKEMQVDEFMARLLKRMEHAAENRKSETKGGLANGQPEHGQGDGESEDPFAKLARKVRNVRDLLRVLEYHDDYATSQVVRVYDPAPMTLVDATQDLMQDLGGGLWPDPTSGTPDWDTSAVGEAIDWVAIFNNYTMTESFNMA
ncbi:hypothetical protein L209DRAFT_680633 [Thermothelomyces heterothallicus CBS 203.75]